MIRFVAFTETALAGITAWVAFAAWEPGHAPAALLPAAAVTICAALSFYYCDLYDFSLSGNFFSFATRLPQALAIMLMLWGGVQIAWPAAGVPLGSSLAGIASISATVLLVRSALYGWLHIARRSRVLILGSGPLAVRLRQEMAAQPHRRLRLAGVVDTPPAPAEMDRLVNELRPDRIVVALEDRRGLLPLESLARARALGVVVEEAVDLYERLSGKLAIESMRPGNLIFAAEMHKSRLDLAITRLCSLAAAIAGLTLAAPFMALIALAVRLDSPGPAFFRQARVGWRGRRFEMIKFRTMRPVEKEASVWARDNDARITRVGRVLRKFRLDELPQLLNMLRGDMNLVGPRPHPLVNYDLFLRRIPHYGLREMVRPGVTGWAQIRYTYANNLEEETEKMRYDLYYIKHMSMGFDVRILFDTVKVVLLGRESRTTATTHRAARGDAARRHAARGGDTAA
jgi:exopolysaccharide biosynthesis polyprenyl glycosylphosphotransferase